MTPLTGGVVARVAALCHFRPRQPAAPSRILAGLPNCGIWTEHQGCTCRKGGRDCCAAGGVYNGSTVNFRRTSSTVSQRKFRSSSFGLGKGAKYRSPSLHKSGRVVFGVPYSNTTSKPMPP